MDPAGPARDRPTAPARLLVRLAPGWDADLGVDCPAGGTYRHQDGTSRVFLADAGIWTDAHPPTDRHLLELARTSGLGVEQARVLTTDRGGCAAGRFGTATFWAPDLPFAQAWCLTNGHVLVRAMYTTTTVPAIEQVLAVHEMVLAIRILMR